MTCPKCGSDMFVIDSRENKTGIRRRRECRNCLYRMTTTEISLEQKAKFEKDEIKLRTAIEMLNLLKGV